LVVNQEVEHSSRINSKFMRAFLVIISAVLLFVGPTYIPYLMTDVLKIDVVISSVVGLALFIAGIVMLVYLAKKKVIT
jgi:uncharacterized membrane protein HdeD (DUF308 family)